jgi:hypothetical protein
VKRSCFAYKLFQSLLVDLVFIAEVNYATNVAFHAELNSTAGTFDAASMREGHLLDALVGLNHVHDPGVLPYRCPPVRAHLFSTSIPQPSLHFALSTISRNMASISPRQADKALIFA